MRRTMLPLRQTAVKLEQDDIVNQVREQGVPVPEGLSHRVLQVGLAPSPNMKWSSFQNMIHNDCIFELLACCGYITVII